MGYFRRSTARLEFWWLAHTLEDCRVEAYGRGEECTAVRKSLNDLRAYMQTLRISAPLPDVAWESFLCVLRRLTEPGGAVVDKDHPSHRRRQFAA